MRGVVITAAVIMGVAAVACGTIAYAWQAPPPGQRLALTPPTDLEKAQKAQGRSSSVSAPPAAIPTPRPPAHGDSDDPRPGRAIPRTSADPAVYDVTWDDGLGRSWRTRITIHSGSAALRRSADVATRELGANQDQVTYRAQAFTAAGGVIHIDARGAAVAGLYSGDWSPDSFAISPDLQVEVMDDSHDPSRGHVTQITRE